jgi:hypothetical protein
VVVSEELDSVEEVAVLVVSLMEVSVLVVRVMVDIYDVLDCVEVSDVSVKLTVEV